MAQSIAKRDAVKFTYEDYLLLPDDGKRYEIIEGELYMTPSPIIKHQNISSELVEKIRRYVNQNRLGTVLYAPCDVIFSKTNIVQPDIIFVSKSNRAIIKEKNIQGAPDLLVEITSPNTRKRDLVLKKKLYAKFDVQEYWIVFTEEEKVEVWRLAGGAYELDGAYEKQERLLTPLLKGLQIDLTEIFRDIEDYF